MRHSRDGERRPRRLPSADPHFVVGGYQRRGASNFAQIFDAIKEYKKRRASKKAKTEFEPLMDAFWGTKLPYPLPGPGAKVTITGNYSTAFTRATSGTEADPILGIMTYDEIEYLEEPAELATLPGIKP